MTSREPRRPHVDSYRIFSEPVTVVSWRDQDAFNKSLSRLILAQERREEGVRRSNNGGWHSKRGLFRSSPREVAELKRRVGFTLTVAHEALRTTEPCDGLNGWRFSSWANVSRRGDWNGLHYHGKAAWAGVYYVRVGDKSRPPAAPGHLVLYDLRQLKKWDGQGDPPADTRTHRIPPEAGRLVLLPGQLWHATEVFSGPGARISIAFNLTRGAPRSNRRPA